MSKETKSELLVNSLIKNGAIHLMKNQIAVGNSIVKYECQGDIFYLDILTTTPEFRKQGHCKKAMLYLCHLAKEVGATIELVCAPIKKSSFGLGIDLAGINGAITKDKIPVKDLPKFYSKFGFKTIGKVSNRIKMSYN